MRYRTFGRTGWQVSEVGYGMWGMAGWTGSDDEESHSVARSRHRTGLQLLRHGMGLRRRQERADSRARRCGGTPARPLYVATKVPPKNRQWPARSGRPLDEVFPADYIREYTEKSLANIGVPSLDLQQFHVWNDAWAPDERWQRAVRALEGRRARQGVRHQRQPVRAGQRAAGARDRPGRLGAGRLQRPRPEPGRRAVSRRASAANIAVIARVPFDEGSLTGTLTADARWPEGDFRNRYFTPENLAATLPAGRRRCRHVVPAGMTLPELALRHILQHPAVTTVIPGMRKIAHVEQNLGASDGRPASAALMAELRGHRWNRTMDWE